MVDSYVESQLKRVGVQYFKVARDNNEDGVIRFNDSLFFECC